MLFCLPWYLFGIIYIEYKNSFDGPASFKEPIFPKENSLRIMEKYLRVKGTRTIIL